MVWKYFLPSCKSPFHFADYFLCCAEFFFFHLCGTTCLFLRLGSYPRNHCQSQYQESLSLFSYRRFKVSYHVYALNPFWFDFNVWCKIKVQFYSFACGYPTFLTTLNKDTIFSLLCIIALLINICLSEISNLWIYFKALCFVPLINMSVYFSGPYLFGY